MVLGGFRSLHVLVLTTVVLRSATSACLLKKSLYLPTNCVFVVVA